MKLYKHQKQKKKIMKKYYYVNCVIFSYFLI